MKIVPILVTTLLAAVVFGCDKLTHSEGFVVDKIYEPPRSWISVFPMSTGNVTMLIPYRMHDDEDFVVVCQLTNTYESGYVEHKQVRYYLPEADWERIRKDDACGPSTPASVAARDPHGKERKNK